MNVKLIFSCLHFMRHKNVITTGTTQTFLKSVKLFFRKYFQNFIFSFERGRIGQILGHFKNVAFQRSLAECKLAALKMLMLIFVTSLCLFCVVHYLISPIIKFLKILLLKKQLKDFCKYFLFYFDFNLKKNKQFFLDFPNN